MGSAAAAAPAPSRPRPSVAVLLVGGALAAAAVASLMYVGRGRTFFFDEWDWVQHRAEGGLGTLWRPHNGHLMPLPVALYRLQFELVGFAPAWPVRLVTAVAHVAAAAVLFRLARVRVGTAGAAAAGLVFLGLGAAWQTLLWGIQLSVTIAVLGGLLAWDALDRRRARWDVVACAALVVAGASFSIGPILAVAVAVELALDGRLRAAWWVPAIPLGAFAVAYLAAVDAGPTAAGWGGAIGWAADAGAAAVGGLAVLGPGYGRLGLLAIAVAVVVTTARRRATPRLAGLVVAALLVWVLMGASRSSGPHADSAFASRYVEIGAPLVLLVVVELCRGRRLTGWWRWPVALAVAGCLWRGVGELVEQGAVLRRNSDVVLASVAAMELGRAHLDGNMIPFPDGAPQLRAEDYLRAIDAARDSPIGDPAATLGRLPAPARVHGDAVLATIELRPTPAVVAAAGCTTTRGPTVVSLAPGTSVRIGATGDAVAIDARRFADVPSPLLDVAPGGATEIAALGDADARPWQLGVSSSSDLTVCGP